MFVLWYELKRYVLHRVPKCKFFCAGGFDCSIIAQKMYESQQTNFAIK